MLVAASEDRSHLNRPDPREFEDECEYDVVRPSRPVTSILYLRTLSRAARYSLTTRLVSSSTEVSRVR
jgi:hypothetical protein